ncbi:MAG: hypothetical protein IBJ03_06645 [Gemmatimonadaceae bacterium]|nr:hypothetical protein [Gemmatimonadaceae bacterium]
MSNAFSGLSISQSAQLSEHLVAGEQAVTAGQHSEAARSLQAAADLVPADLAIARMAAVAWQTAGSRHRAREVLGRAVRLTDLSTLSDTTSYEVGAMCLDVGAPDLALACFSVTARLRPGNPALLGAMASAHRALGALDEAWRLADQAVSRDKKNPALLLTAAQVRHAQLRFDDALQWLKKAEAVRPLHSPTRMQRALTRLIRGPSRQGWEDFEHRGLPALPAGSSWWRGEPLDGRSIRVVMEQGIGDLFHFVRYVPLLSERGAGSVVVEAPEAAVSLLAAAGYSAIAAGTGAKQELCVPLLSLPWRLGDLSESDFSAPYIRIDNDSKPADGLRAGLGGRGRVGLIAAGNPSFLATNLRDLDEATVEAILAIPGIDWVWLLPDRNPPKGFTGENPSLSHEWLNTALFMSQLDAIVSVDTAGAHLAGAMGIPVHVLLPYTPDWRWGGSGDRTPLYPSARLVREASPASWASVLPELQALLGT